MDLRLMRPDEAVLFADIEAPGRPYPWTASQFVGATAPPSSVLVWEEDGALLGYAAVQVVGYEAYLQNLMVPPDLRRRGHGGRLLQKVMIWVQSRGAARLLLDVAAENADAVRLYERSGFSTLERRRRSYPRGEDALVMKKDL